jgi:hypothetical protein
MSTQVARPMRVLTRNVCNHGEHQQHVAVFKANPGASSSRVANAAPEAGIPPQFAGVALVTDWRQPAAAIENGARGELLYVTYPITNAGWLQATQVASLRARIGSRAQKRLAMQRAAVAIAPWKRGLARCLIAVSLLPILYLACRPGSRPRHRPENPLPPLQNG